MISVISTNIYNMMVSHLLILRSIILSFSVVIVAPDALSFHSFVLMFFQLIATY